MIRNIQLSIQTLVMLATLLSTMGLAADTAQDINEPCQCRDRDGQRQDLGSIDCFDISGTRSLFRCEMSTNTPYWKRIDDHSGCPLAHSYQPPRWLKNLALASALKNQP